MPTGLIRRGARYSVRRRVPLELVDFYGRKEIVRALGTADPKEARKRLPHAWAALGKEFDEAAASLKAMDASASSPKPARDPDFYAAKMLEHLRKRRAEAAASATLPEFKQHVEDQLAYNQAVLDGELYPEVSLAQHEGLRNAQRAFLTGDGSLAIPSVVTETMQSDLGGANPTVRELHAIWAKQQERPRSTVQGMQRAVDRFVQVIGDKRVRSITRIDLTTFTDKMRQPGVVTPKGVSIPSMNTTLSLMSALFGLAQKRGAISSNPAAKTQLADTRHAREKRRDFDALALASIFGSAVYRDAERPVGGAGEAAYWLPLLALYTGARINELAQLHPSDIALEEYVDPEGRAQRAWIIRIEHNPGKGKRLKNEGSERRVPVHEHLIELGFVAYAQAQAGKRLLFPELKLGPRDRAAGNWGRWFGRYLRETCGVTDKRMTFHSFRHTFKHHARLCLITKELNDVITGHKSGDAGDGYGGMSYPLHPLVEAMKRYRVADLELPTPPQ